MPRFHSLLKRQMIGRSRGGLWTPFRRWGAFDLLVNVTFRVSWHTTDGYAYTLDIGKSAGDTPNFCELLSYTDLNGTPWSGPDGDVGWHYGPMWGYYGQGGAFSWKCDIFPWWTGYAFLSGDQTVNQPTFAPSPSDANFYMLRIKDDGGTVPGASQFRVAYFLANRQVNGGAPGGKGNWHVRESYDAGFGAIILDGIELRHTRKPSDPDEPGP